MKLPKKQNDNNQDNNKESKKTVDSNVSKLIRKSSDNAKEHTAFDTIKEYTSVLIVFAIIFLLIFLVIIPQYKAVKVNKRSIEKLQAESEKVTEHLKYLQRLSSLKDELASNKELATQSVPESEDVPYFLNQLINIADISNVELIGLSFGGVTKSTKPTEPSMVKANMSVKGDYYSILDFIKRLENSRKLIYADNIRVTIDTSDRISSQPSKQDTTSSEAQLSNNNDNDTKSGEYTVSLTLTSFFMPDPDTSNLDIDALTSKPQPEPVLRKIKSMEYYEPADVDLKIGTLNPFVKNEDKITNTGNLSGNEDTPSSSQGNTYNQNQYNTTPNSQNNRETYNNENETQRVKYERSDIDSENQ